MEELVDDCEYSLELLIEELKKSEEDIGAGRVLDYSGFKEKLKTKYNI